MENETYEKVDNSLKVTTETTEVKEEIYSIDFLKAQKKSIEDQIVARQSELKAVEALIAKAEELGVGEEVIEVNEEV